MARNVTVIADKSFVLEQEHELFPTAEEGVTRADLHLGGFIIRQTDKRCSHLTVVGEIDFKIAKFLYKNIGLKAGNYAQMVAEYAALSKAQE